MISATRSDIRFWYQGRIVSLSHIDPQRTVLKWLREDLGHTGTKEGCGEGDCGACTVAIGTLDPAAPQGLRVRAVNSCLLFLPALDGKALFTVEDVADGDNLHPVQRALVDLHASQCGFCTPGFVMSLWADYQARPEVPSREDTLDTLSGNLCRCTGYRPLIDAAKAAREYPRVEWDRQPVSQALTELQGLDPLDYEWQGHRWQSPKTAQALADAVQASPDSRLIGGATDLALQVTKGLKDLGSLISVTSVTDLAYTKLKDDVWQIGAATSLDDAFRALASTIPELDEFRRRFASTPVRNAGTLVGNVANGSPIGDSMPVLLSLGTTIVLANGQSRRAMPLEEYYLAYQKTARLPGEVVVELQVPIPKPKSLFRAWKVSKRRDQDISAVCAAFHLSFDGKVVSDAKIGYGGMAAIPSRARGAEQALIGKVWNETSVEWARRAILEQFSPLTDGRATSNYRATVAANLLTRLYEDYSETLA